MRKSTVPSNNIEKGAKCHSPYLVRARLRFFTILSFSTAAILLSFCQSGLAQNQFDISFLDRPNHKLKPTFQLSGEDFGKHSYKRMLLNSPYGASSVGLGAEGRNPAYNNQAFDLMHPESHEINTPSETQKQFIENAYQPKLKKGYSTSYETDSSFKRGAGDESGGPAIGGSKSTGNNPFDRIFSEHSKQPGSNSLFSAPNAEFHDSKPKAESEVSNPAPRDGVPSFLQDTGKPRQAEPSFF